MKSVALMQSGGGTHLLLPPDCTLQTAPIDLFNAIDHASRIIYWQENLSDKEMPERWQWHLDWEIEEHFKILKQKRDDGKDDPSDSPSSNSGDEEPVWEDNVYSARFK
jgi:hypothetical protein